MFEERVNKFKSERHGEGYTRLVKAPEGNPSVVFTFESPIGSIDFSLNYKKTEQGIGSAIKRFEGADLADFDNVVDSIKKELGLSAEGGCYE